MLAIKVHAVALSSDCSQSFANLRQRPSQAKKAYIKWESQDA
jgi:hypothetical protein